MKFIKTFWPGIIDKVEPYLLRMEREELYAFSLSSLLLLKYHQAELYTDNQGALLIKHLGLNFTNIHVVEPISDSYWSVNDLYVLSIQDQPATLIQDNLLLTGHLDIDPEDVQLLGLDINSFKLVKSVIKMMRLETEIPFFDDNFLRGKSSYVDTSMITISTGSVLKNYFHLVSGFLQANKERLAAYDRPIINNFFFIYWLFAYLRFKDIKITFYFKDPLNLKLGGNAFDFSRTNIVQNIFKIYDHNFGSIEFERHFQMYFRYQDEYLFNQIQKYLIKNQNKFKDNSRLRLKRTGSLFNRICQRCSNLSTSPFKFTKNFQNKVSRLLLDANLEEEQKRITDIFNFEKYAERVYRYYHEKETEILRQEKLAFENILKYWDIADKDFRDLTISVNPFLFLTESSWKWCTAYVEGIDATTISELKVIYNEKEHEAYYLTAFIPNLFDHIAFEFNVDKRSVEIIDFFSEPHSINEFLEFLSTGTNSIDKSALDELFVKRTKHLILTNLLCIDEQPR